MLSMGHKSVVKSELELDRRTVPLYKLKFSMREPHVQGMFSIALDTNPPLLVR
jgi:hypothetical protein